MASSFDCAADLIAPVAQNRISTYEHGLSPPHRSLPILPALGSPNGGNGLCLIPVKQSVLDEITGVYRLGRQFFARPSAEKHRFAVPAYVEGYREIGPEYSLVPNRPDLTESFSMWYRNKKPAGFADWAADCPLYPGIRHCADTLSEVTADLFPRHGGAVVPGAPRLGFQKASYIQLNYTNQRSTHATCCRIPTRTAI